VDSEFDAQFQAGRLFMGLWILLPFHATGSWLAGHGIARVPEVGLALPFLTARDILYVFHILRC
jgi:hypothetical protein